MQDLGRLPNPKRDKSSSAGRAGWYPYYAGFSSDFAQAALNHFAVTSSEKVLDPWNGSGTTTAVTAGKGCEAFGFDLNPVMIIVARARLMNKRERPSLLPLANLIANLKVDAPTIASDDPLLVWYQLSSVIQIRTMEFSLQKSLLGVQEWSCMERYLRTSAFSDISAFFYVALFRTIRTLLLPFQSSNPTWTKSPRVESEKIDISRTTLRAALLSHIVSMEAALDDDPIEKDGKVTIKVANSSSLPLERGSMDFVLSSPPYCTRIDYASATKAELAVLGLRAGTEYDLFRNSLIGTTTIASEVPTTRHEWGAACQTFLAAVKGHSSRASASYYFKGYCQYFHGVFESLREMRRCLRPSGIACLVVQDSFYKEVHTDLPTIYTEMAGFFRMENIGRQNFTYSHGMRSLNTTSQKYRASSSATESVLAFCNT